MLYAVYFGYMWLGAAVLAVALYLHVSKKEEGYDGPLNVYGEKLQRCNDGGVTGDSSVGGTCSEEIGGVHQICAKDIGREGVNFSRVTAQGDWSDEKRGVNHCLCLGAWANYAALADASNVELKCSAIPETALSPEYVSKWAKWNDNTVSGQARTGITSLVRKCSRGSTPSQLRYLNRLRDKIL